MKNPFTGIRRHKKVLLAGCLTVAAGVSVWSGSKLLGAPSAAVGNYLYNAEFTSAEPPSTDSPETKILGEARSVDTKADNVETAATDADAYFTSAVINRERSRTEALETLQTVVDCAETLPERREEALGSMMTIASAIETESLIEELVRAKGFTDCFAVIHDDEVNVVVQTPGLLTAEVAQITEIAMHETGFPAENIKIVEFFP